MNSNCTIKELPEYNDIKPFSSYKIKVKDDIVLELRIHNAFKHMLGISIYEHTDSTVTLIYQNLLTEITYNMAVRILKDKYYYIRLYKKEN